MRTRIVALVLGVWLFATVEPGALAGQTAFKLGTFRQGNRTFVGAVLNDTTVVDLAAADSTLPRDLKQIIARYGMLRTKIAAVVSAAADPNSAGRYHAVAVDTLKVLPPVMPRLILNATLNYQEHANELARNPGAVSGVSVADTQANQKPVDSVPGIWMRKPGDTRQNPYVFQKPTTAVIANGEAIRIPAGRDQIDAECELTLVVGNTASRVPVERADDYIFGYTIENDVSDRRGRQDERHGSDWFVAKGFDTFAPIGPYIVPKEFVPNPQKLAVKLMLNDRVMTNSNTSGMTHTVWELLSFVSHIAQLQPGDMIDTGSPPGVGASSGLFLKPGDVSTCSIESVGTLRNPVR